MQVEEILETARQFVADGKQKEAQDFIVAHFEELPEDLQGDLLIEFIKDAGSKNKFQNLAIEVGEAAEDYLHEIDAAEKELQQPPAGK